MKRKFLYLFSVFLIIVKWGILYADTSINNKIALTPKMLREVKIMENRHFKSRSDNGESNAYRLERLEIELMGRSYEGLPLEDRMKTLKLASQRRMLKGVSLPPSVSKHFSPKHIYNDSIYVVPKNDDVGIIDGLIRLYMPEFYKQYRAQRQKHHEIYGD